MRSAIVTVALCMVLLGVGAAAAQDGYYTVGGVEYYYATGVYGSGHLTMGFDPAAAELEDFQGCGWGKVRPDNNRGRVEVIGAWHGLPFFVDMVEFPEPGVPDALGPGLEVEAGPGAGTIVVADIGAAGTATGSLNGVPIVDPVTGSEYFAATWFVTSKGYRSDDTGRMSDEDGGLFVPGGALARGKSMEMHLHFASDPELPRQPDWSAGVDSGPVPIAPQEGYEESWGFENHRLAGTGMVAFEASSIAVAGENDFEVRIQGPDGSVLARERLAPSVGQDAAASLDFDLNMTGSHSVVVAGNVSLLQYSVEVTQRAPESFGMDLWWDDVSPGYAGHQAQNECRTLADGPRMASYAPDQGEPVGFDWLFSLYTVGAGVTLALVTAGIIGSARGHAASRKDIHN